MELYYLTGPVFVVGALLYGFFMLRRAKNMSPEESAMAFHNAYADYFELQPNETVVGAWSGLDFQGPQSAEVRAAGKALNYAAAHTVGVSTYVPIVHIVLTSSGRVLVSREYSDLGERGNFRQVKSLPPGARALSWEQSHPGEKLGSIPRNPSDIREPLEFVHVRGASGEFYEAWIGPRGARVDRPGFVSILDGLQLSATSSQAVSPSDVRAAHASDVR